MANSVSDILGSYPNPKSAGFSGKIRDVAAVWENGCPIDRGTTYYFSTSGNDANDGLTPDTPKQSVAEMNTVLSGGGDKAVLLKSGDTWRTETQIDLGDNNTLSSYGTGPRPRITGLVNTIASGGSSWTLASGDRYTASVASLGWLICESREWSERMELVADTAAVESTANSWFHDAGVLHVNAGSGVNPNSLDWSYAPGTGTTRDGVQCGAGSRVHGLLIDGQEMRPSSGQSYAVQCVVTGEEIAVLSECEFYYHSLHNAGRNQSESGSRVLIRDCTFGWCHTNTSTMLVSFAGNGGNEFICLDCKCPYGLLPRNGLERNDQVVFAHTSGGANVVDGFYIVGLEVDGSAGVDSPMRLGSCGDLADTSHALEDVRAVFYGCKHGRHPNAATQFCLDDHAYVSCELYLQPRNRTIASVDNNNSDGWVLSCLIDIDFADIVGNIQGVVNASGTGGNVQPKLINSVVHLRHNGTSSVRLGFNWDILFGATPSLTNARVINCIMLGSNDGGGHLWPAVANDATNCRNNAVFGFTSGGDLTGQPRYYGSWTNTIDLASLPDTENFERIDSLLDSGDDTFADLPEVDLFGRALAAPGQSVGPLGRLTTEAGLSAASPRGVGRSLNRTAFGRDL